jgi:hypothetical protein
VLDLFACALDQVNFSLFSTDLLWLLYIIMLVYKLENECLCFPPRELFTFQLHLSTEYLDESLYSEYIQCNQEFVIMV